MARILIIEDQADIRRLLRWALEPDDHEVMEATNGEAGLEKLHQVAPALVLCDIMMSGLLNGLDVCRRIRSDPRYEQTPVVMISAKSSEQDRRDAKLAGADDFITKPYSPLMLSSRVAKLLAEARARPQAVGDTPRLGERAATAPAGTAIDPTRPDGAQQALAADGTEAGLVHCIYTSEVNPDLDGQAMAKLLQSARSKNERLGLSGMLLMAGTDIFQVLEGPADVIDATYAKIERDPRHKRVIKIVREPIAVRSFADWTMGFSKFTDQDLAAALGANDFFSEGRCLAALDEGRARRLLEGFREGRWRQSLAGRRSAGPA